MSRVRKRYPRLYRPAMVTIVLVMVAAVAALLVGPTIVTGIGDPWANAVWDSYRVKDPGLAVGAPDSSYARLEYNGYLDLDLGAAEIAYNGPGADVKVYGKGTSKYDVYAWGSSWHYLGTGWGTSSFDLGGLASTQYVRVLPAPSRVYVDAVEALYLEPPNEPPQPRFISPDEGASITGDSVTVAAVDDSGEDDIIACQFQYYYDVNCDGLANDGSSWTEMQEVVAGTVLGSPTPPPGCSIEWDVSDLPDCCYIMRVYMEDSGGLTGYAYRSVELSKNNPEPAIVGWDEFTDCDNTILSGVVTLTAEERNATDQGMDIDLGEGSSSVEFMYCYGGQDCDCDTGWMTIPGTVVQHDECGRWWTLDWDTTVFSDCCYRVRVEMTDKHGLAGTSDEYCVALSNHAPAPVFVQPDDCENVSGNVTLEVRDDSFEAGADITGCVSFSYCDYSYDECPCGPGCDGTWVPIGPACEPDVNGHWSIEWDTSGIEDCYHVVKAEMEDCHGLVGNGTVCIGIANEPPVAEITSPATGGTYSGDVTITVIDGLGAGDIAGAKFFYWYDGNCTSYENCTDPGPESEEWVYIGEDWEPGDGMSIEWDTSELPDCCYVVAAVVFDVHDLGDYDIACIEVSNHYPEPEIVDPADGCFENDAVSGVVTLTAEDFGFDGGADIDIVNNATGNCSVDFYYCYDGVDGDCDCTDWTAIAGPVTQHDGGEGKYWTVSWNTTGLEDCCHHLKVEITDMHGRTGTGYACVGVNNSDPVAHIVAPCDSGNVTECNDCIIGGNVSVVVEETSVAQDLGCAEFYYYDDENGDCVANDGKQWVKFATVNEAVCNGNCTFTAYLDTIGLELHDCCWILKAIISDVHGGVGEDTMCIAVSNNDPEPVIDHPNDGYPCWYNWVSDYTDYWLDPVYLEAFDGGLDEGADIASCVFEVWHDFNQNCLADDGNSTWVEIGSADEWDYNDWVYEWDSASVPDECYLIRANMTDAHGRYGYSDWINLYVNWRRPAPYITQFEFAGYNDATPDYGAVECGETFDIRVIEAGGATDFAGLRADYLVEGETTWEMLSDTFTWSYNAVEGRYEWLVEDCLLSCDLDGEYVYIRVTVIDKFWEYYEYFGSLWADGTRLLEPEAWLYADYFGIGSDLVRALVEIE
ncbi:MAG: hypothetical protein SVP26_04075 [Chloroflexota bacterium]|nr:hypothetical protein [Chloroflexota bacterium]